MKSFVDTTILVDYLLKSGDKKEQSKYALQKCEESYLPQYAIKEFKAGPLQYFAWFYNRLSKSNSFLKAIGALQKLSLTPQRHRLSTALEALMEVHKEISNKPVSYLSNLYGEKAKIDIVLNDRFRLSLKRKILTSWKNRRNVTTKTGNELVCYTELAPIESNGLFNLKPSKCNTKRCCLTEMYRSLVGDIQKIDEKLLSEEVTEVNRKRHKIMREIIRKKKYYLSDTECRQLGDVYFVCFCPNDHKILTTNIKDHKPLAEAIGKNAISPSDLLTN